MEPFRRVDKRLCGFLFLRTIRTGSRALSLERGSLLDIILKLQEKRLQMWEDVLEQLRKLPVAEQPELGLTSILSSVQEAIKTFVPADWADKPHMRVSDLTRENLRKTLTVFLATGATRTDGGPHSAPFQHQGTGTINALVLALLSMIADLKQNVIFADGGTGDSDSASHAAPNCCRRLWTLCPSTVHVPFAIRVGAIRSVADFDVAARCGRTSGSSGNVPTPR